MQWHTATGDEMAGAKWIENQFRDAPDAVARGGVASNEGGWRNRCPELVLSRISGLPHTDVPRGADVGELISVKSVEFPKELNLFVPPYMLHKDHVYVLAEWAERDDVYWVRFLGYATYEKVKNGRLTRLGKDRPPGHFVSRHSLETCPVTQQQWKAFDSKGWF